MAGWLVWLVVALFSSSMSTDSAVQKKGQRGRFVDASRPRPRYVVGVARQLMETFRGRHSTWYSLVYVTGSTENIKPTWFNFPGHY